MNICKYNFKTLLEILSGSLTLASWLMFAVKIMNIDESASQKVENLAYVSLLANRISI